MITSQNYIGNLTGQGNKYSLSVQQFSSLIQDKLVLIVTRTLQNIPLVGALCLADIYYTRALTVSIQCLTVISPTPSIGTPSHCQLDGDSLNDPSQV